MVHPFDHLLFVALALFGPLWAATFGYRRLTRATPDRLPTVRRSVYRVAMTVQWGLTGALAVDWIVTRRSWALLGLVPRWGWGAKGVALGALIMIVVIVRQRSEVLRSDTALDEVRERLDHVKPMLPRTPGEMRTFVALAITAGICEEVLYRGFMIQYLAHGMTWILAAALSSLIFGIGHAYQGPRGIALTALVGSFLAAVYWVSGSLFAPMLLHGLMDLHSGHLAYVALRRHDQREREQALSLAVEAPAPPAVPEWPA